MSAAGPRALHYINYMKLHSQDYYVRAEGAQALHCNITLHLRDPFIRSDFYPNWPQERGEPAGKHNTSSAEWAEKQKQ